MTGGSRQHLTRHAPYKAQAFTALNTAFIHDGAFLYVPKGARLKKSVHMLFVSTDEKRTSVDQPRNLLVMDEGSQVELVESYATLTSGDHFTNPVTEIVLGEGAHLEHFRLVREQDHAYQPEVLEPTLAVLDETDSGLDIDALKAVADGIVKLKHPDRSIILVTHYQRMLNYITPDQVQVSNTAGA